MKSSIQKRTNKLVKDTKRNESELQQREKQSSRKHKKE